MPSVILKIQHSTHILYNKIKKKASVFVDFLCFFENFFYTIVRKKKKYKIYYN